MENVEKIEKLLIQAGRIDCFFNNQEKYAADKRHYDKVGYGFNVDDRFKASESFQIWFSSWHGTYGHSSCSSVLSMDSEIFKSYLLRFLNKNKNSILKEIAAEIRADAAKFKEQAIKELQSKLETINRLAGRPEE